MKRPRKFVTVRTKATPCPFCLYNHDAIANMDSGKLPRPHCFSICLRCQGILILDADLIPRVPTVAQMAAAESAEPGFVEHLQKYREAAADVVKRHQTGGKPPPRRP